MPNLGGKVPRKNGARTRRHVTQGGELRHWRSLCFPRRGPD